MAAERFNSRMQTLPREDFPALPEATGTGTVSLPRDALREMVAKTQFAVTGEDTRYFLNGALLVFSRDSDEPRGVPMAIAWRSCRLAGRAPAGEDETTKGEDSEEARVILPKKTLWELGRLLGEGDEVITYERGENHLFFDIGGRQLVSRVLDAQFPAYERVIPKGNDKRVEFERDRLTSAIKRVALLSNERSRAVKMQIDVGKVEISSSSPEVGEASGSPIGGI